MTGNRPTPARTSAVNWLTLFASSGTLICCALPIVLVTLGMGAAVASLTSSFPLLITLSRYKIWVFAISGILLAVSFWLTYRNGRVCPTDPALARLCEQAGRWNRRILWASIVIWSLGFFAAFLALPLRKALGI